MSWTIAISDKTEIWLATSFFTILFFCWYPANLLIIDEWFYLRQGIAYASGHPFLTEINYLDGSVSFIEPGKYPVGVPFFLSFFILLFGNKAVFLQGFFSLVGSIILVSLVLKNLKLSTSFSLLLFLFFPVVLLSRALMSGLPSLLFISGFLYLLTRSEDNKITLFCAGLIGGLSILFREPNILLVAPFIAGICYKEPLAKSFWLITGLIVAIGLRCFLVDWAFGDFFFTKDPGIPFSLQYAFKNALFYLPFLMIFIPFGLISVWKYKGWKKWELKIALLIFVGLYLTYNYTGIAYSGIKSIILGSRFLIPGLPLFIIAISWCFSKQLQPFILLKSWIFPLAISSIVVTQSIGAYFGNAQSKIAQNLENEKGKIHLNTNKFDLPKILNPINLDFKIIYLEDTSLVNEILERDSFMYVETSSRLDNLAAKNNSDYINDKVFSFLEAYSSEKIFEGSLPDKTIICQYKIRLPFAKKRNRNMKTKN